MKSILVLRKGLGLSATLVACSAWWLACGGTSTTADPTDAGSGTETSTPEAGSPPADGGGTDAASEAAVLPVDLGPFLDVQYKNCTPLAACGGDPKGLWKVTGACVSEKVFDPAKAQCPNLVESNVKFQARGIVSTTATTIARKLDVKFTATFAVPAQCKNANPVGTTCKDAETAIKFAGLKTATCKDNAGTGGCDCDVANDLSEDTSDAYTVSGNTLTANARTFDYCVNGNEIKYTETTAKAPVPAVFTLTK
jgi:hypothetical protein